VRLEIRSIEKSNELIGTRPRDLPACSTVPQLTTLPRARNAGITFPIAGYARYEVNWILDLMDFKQTLLVI
jgi:hypothetical protein